MEEAKTPERRVAVSGRRMFRALLRPWRHRTSYQQRLFDLFAQERLKAELRKEAHR